MAVNTWLSPGASITGAGVIGPSPTNRSATFTFVNVTLPVLVTVKLYVITLPSTYVSWLAVLTIAISGV